LLPFAGAILSLLAIVLSPASLTHRLALFAVLTGLCVLILVREHRTSESKPVRLDILPGGNVNWWFADGRKKSGNLRASSWNSPFLTVISAQKQTGREWFLIPAISHSSSQYRRLRCGLRLGRWQCENPGKPV
jgi:hypothetical protein